MYYRVFNDLIPSNFLNLNYVAVNLDLHNTFGGQKVPPFVQIQHYFEVDSRSGQLHVRAYCKWPLAVVYRPERQPRSELSLNRKEAMATYGVLSLDEDSGATNPAARKRLTHL